MSANPNRKHRPDEPLVDTRMKRLYNTLEPSIINKKLLTLAVYEQGPKDEAGKIAKHEGIEFYTVRSLRLDFKNILYISNLWQFKSLVKLQLVHNIIEKIENLDTLVTLEWLDLSFNKIQMIEGLDNLVRLTDFSLYHNQITNLQNMDNLQELNVFSIGRNMLTSMDNVLYLKKFKKLKSINLAGNPLCQSQEYFSLIFAFFPNLMFLDYKMITKDEHQVSYEMYLIKVEQFKEKEAEEEKILEENKTTNEARKIHKKAFVELLDTDALFCQMIYDDPDHEKLFCITGVEEHSNTYRDKFLPVCLEMFQKGISELERRKRDASLFYDCINTAKNENNQKAQDLISEFNIYKNKIFQDINKANMVSEEEMKTLKEMTYNLWNNLMSLEVQLYDQLEETIKDYMRNLTEMVEHFMEIMHNYFSQLREMETAFTDRIGEYGMIVFEKVMKGDIEEERLANLKRFDIFGDKETFTNMMATSHDHRLLKVDMWQDQMRIISNAWLQQTCTEVHLREEQDRNRTRITEINNFVDQIRSDIENNEMPGVNIN